MTFHCQKCGERFSTKSSLNRHVLNKVCEDHDLECKICHKYYDTLSGYKRHVQHCSQINNNENVIIVLTNQIKKLETELEQTKKELQLVKTELEQTKK